MKRGPLDRTLSGYEHLSDEDMAWHRATGGQIPKDWVDPQGTVQGQAEALLSSGVVLDVERYLGSGRTVITVSSAADFDKLAVRDDLPEGVEVVVVDPKLSGVFKPLPDTPPMDLDFFAGLAALSGMGQAYGALSAAEKGTELHRDIEAGVFDDILTPGYVPFADSSLTLKPLPPRFDYYEGARYSKWAGRKEQQAKRVAKDREKRKAARKQRRNKR